MLKCVVCESGFKRPGTRGPVPKYCSQRCRTKAGRTAKRIEYERNYRRQERASGNRKAYEFEYNRRPEVRARGRKRMFFKWHNDPEYRAKQLARWGIDYPDVVVPAPYTGHRWLDMAREAVRATQVDPSAPWADDYYDDVGEAVLALLEGRDMKEALHEYRKHEYVPRRLTIRLGDWKEDSEYEQRWFDTVMPTTPSAEDEYLDNTEPVEYYEATRFSDVSTRRRRMHHATSTPSNRRSNRR